MQRVCDAVYRSALFLCCRWGSERGENECCVTTNVNLSTEGNQTPHTTGELRLFMLIHLIL
jgi:hypothetical protein